MATTRTKGRQLTKSRPRDRSGRWDPGPKNQTHHYPIVAPAPPPPSVVSTATLEGRPGATDRTLDLMLTDGVLTVATHGWRGFDRDVELTPRQVAFLRAFLDEHLPRD